MGLVTTGFSMSLDGFVALPNNEIGPLFDWYFTGETTHERASGDTTYELSSDGGAMLEDASQATGALVAGRTLFDFTHAWGGKHPLDAPVFVVTHHVETVPDEWRRDGSVFTFVTDGVESAIAHAQAVAGEKKVAIASTTIAQQAMNAGLLDEIHIDLVPVLLGNGVHLFDHLNVAPVRLEISSVSEGPGVTHLTYRVVK